MAGKFTSRTLWRAKLEKPHERKIGAIPPKMARQLGTGTLLIPRPLDVDAVVRKVGKGKLVTVKGIREKLARDGGADVTCPLCTGIFLRIAAETAEEDRAAGKRRITPYWRVVRDDGSLLEKFPGGVAAQVEHLRAEGHDVEPSRGRKPPKVKGFEKRLVKL